MYLKFSVIVSQTKTLEKVTRGTFGSTFGRRAFSVVSPAVWNLLPDQLKDSGCTELTFRRTLKTFFFDQY